MCFCTKPFLLKWILLFSTLFSNRKTSDRCSIILSLLEGQKISQRFKMSNSTDHRNLVHKKLLRNLIFSIFFCVAFKINSRPINVTMQDKYSNPEVLYCKTFLIVMAKLKQFVTECSSFFVLYKKQTVYETLTKWIFRRLPVATSKQWQSMHYVLIKSIWKYLAFYFVSDLCVLFSMFLWVSVKMTVKVLEEIKIKWSKDVYFLWRVISTP